MFSRPLIQIAGVIDAAEAEMLQSCGVRFLGFPLRLPVHECDLTEQEAGQIIQRLSPACVGVLITYLDDAREIGDFCRLLGVQMVQLHGDIAVDELCKLCQSAPQLIIVKSLVVGLHDEKVLQSRIAQTSAYVDAYITDTFDPATGASGATGKTHDWRVSRRLVESSPKPVILAGGLTPGNVREAIRQVRPAGVDVHTGVEDASGRKSHAKVEQFVAEANAGFQELKMAAE